jgi:hypothetical protein
MLGGSVKGAQVGLLAESWRPFRLPQPAFPGDERAAEFLSNRMQFHPCAAARDWDHNHVLSGTAKT